MFSLSERMAVNVVPLVCRLALCVVFLWAGIGKMFHTMELSAEQADALRRVGIRIPEPATPAPVDAMPVDQPAESAPNSDSTTEPVSDPAQPDAPETAPDQTTGAPSSAPNEQATPDQPQQPEPPQIRVLSGAGAQTPSEPEAEPAQPDQPPAQDPPADQPSTPPQEAPETLPEITAPHEEVINGPVPVEMAAPTVTVSRIHSVSLVIAHANDPSSGPRLWPGFLTRKWIMRAAPWVVTVTEIAAGGLLLFGLLTRLSALGLVATMGVAMLLTTIGPAAASGNAFLWILPPLRYADADWIAAWTPWLFQLLLLLMASSLVLTGAGKLSLDRALFGRLKGRRMRPYQNIGSQ